MTPVTAYDTETALIRPGLASPPLACITWQDPGGQPGIYHVSEAKPFAGGMFWSNRLVVGHNVAYDNAVLCAQWPDLLPDVFAKYERDEITDTMLRQKLLDIAAGTYRGRMGDGNVWIKYDYSLQAITKRLTGRMLDKDEWRLKYGGLIDVPLADWPEGARTYPLEDARATLDCFLAQEQHANYLADQFRQARAAWWLHLMSAWGLKTNPEAVDKLERETRAALLKITERLMAEGLVRKDGSRDTKRAKALMETVCLALGKTLRRTATGNVALDADACDETENELLESYAEYSTLNSVLDKDVKALREGTVYPIHTRYDMAETGRVTSSKPNVQNWRRLPGIRECFVPRHGNVFADADYNALELHTLAQACICLVGRSTLADVLNSGLDPHTAFAADLAGVTYAEGLALQESGDEDFDDKRQTAKVANFGIPGGLGPAKLVLFARKTYGVVISEEKARELKTAWLQRWPEMEYYFGHVNNLIGQGEGATFQQLFTGRWRGNTPYCATCNSYFQGLGADVAKRAGFEIAKACYVDRGSVMFGARPVLFGHDQWLVETRDDFWAHDVAHELSRLMVESARPLMPDVPLKAKPLLSRVFSKKAKALKGPDGRLIPWEPHA